MTIDTQAELRTSMLQGPRRHGACLARRMKTRSRCAWLAGSLTGGALAFSNAACSRHEQITLLEQAPATGSARLELSIGALALDTATAVLSHPGDSEFA